MLKMGSHTLPYSVSHGCLDSPINIHVEMRLLEQDVIRGTNLKVPI